MLWTKCVNRALPLPNKEKVARLLFVLVCAVSLSCNDQERLSYLVRVKGEEGYSRRDYSAAIRKELKMASSEYLSVTTVTSAAKWDGGVFYIRFNDVPEGTGFEALLKQLDIELPDGRRVKMQDIVLAMEVDKM